MILENIHTIPWTAYITPPPPTPVQIFLFFDNPSEFQAGFVNMPNLAYFTLKYFKWLYLELYFSAAGYRGSHSDSRNSGMKFWKKKWKLSSYCCSTDATFINLTLQQTSTEHKNKNILWWTCVHTEDITIKCIFISAILNLSLRGQHNHYQSHKLQQSKWHLWLKNHVLHWMDKEIYEAVFTREKRMFCSIKASGEWCTCTTHVLFICKLNKFIK